MERRGNSDDIFGSMEEAIRALRRKGVDVWVEDGALRYRAQRGVVTADDVESLRRSDSALVSLLVRESGPGRFEPRLMARPHPKRAPLAFSQLAHWNLREPTQHRPIRQVVLATRLQGWLQVGALEEAVAEVMRRHEALRTRVVVREGTPVQEVAESSQCRLEVVDVAGIPLYERDFEIQRQIASAILEVADYATDPLFRPVLLRLGENENVLILALDHMISDGASVSIMLGELLAIHAQLLKGRALSLPLVEMQFPDYATWQRAELAGWLRMRASEWQGWRRTRFPEDPSAQGEHNHGWGTVRFVFDARSKSVLQEWARGRKTSIVMGVLTAYVALVLRWCEVSESVVQVMSDGRMSRVVENTVGYFAFPIYLHISVGGHDTFVDLLAAITKEYCMACERPDFAYSHAQEPRPDFTRNTCFNWLPRRGECDSVRMEEGGGSITCSRVPFEHPLCERLDIDAEPSIVFTDTVDNVIGEVHFHRKRFSCATMKRFAENVTAFVDAMVRTPTARIQDVAMT